MFSSRTEWNTAPNKLSALAAEKKLHGESIIDLTVSNPTLCGFEYPKQEIITALSGESALIYEPQPRGLPEARSAIADYYSGQNVSISPEQIIVTASTSEAYSFLFKLLCDPHDNVLVPGPSYPLFDYLCRLNDVRLQNYRLAYDGEWHIDLTSLRNAISDRTRAVIIVHPNNPTGSYIKQDEFEQIWSIACKHNIAIIADEVFEPYTIIRDNRHAVIKPLDSSVLLFSLSGLSKLLGLPQLKLSWIIAHGQSEEISDAVCRLEIIADTFLSVNTPVQTGLQGLFRNSTCVREQINKRIKTNYTEAQTVFSGSRVSAFRAEGGWYLMLQFPQIHNDEDWALKILSGSNILVYPGHFFDMEQGSCIVISLLTPIDPFRQALLQIRNIIEK